MSYKKLFSQSVASSMMQNAFQETPSEVKCPKCGSTQITIMDKRQFGWGRGCLGAVFLGPLLLLLGLTKGSKTQRVCLNCKKRF